MSPKLMRPFESIESAHEFIALLEESIGEALADVEGHLKQALAQKDERQERAISLTIYKLNQLSTHTHKSRRLLNDLRTIRRLLFGERGEID
jgi:hypothetical protein